jgi:tRNA threonylcarbamoyladenosine biosynthesis protein TsaB
MLLAIDTSTRVVGISLYDGYQVAGEYIWNSHDYHTVELAPAIAEILHRAKITASELEALAVALGPGSFTGLRIGLALAKGMALAGHLPLIGIPTLDVLAAAQPAVDLPLAAVLRAGRGRLAVGWYLCKGGKWHSTDELEVMTAETLRNSIRKPTIVVGELTEAERLYFKRNNKTAILVSPAQSLRRPSFLAELAWRRWLAGEIDDPATLSPFYLQQNESIPD